MLFLLQIIAISKEVTRINVAASCPCNFFFHCFI
nr:MAG TPA: hypothetical protein [Bacteriophage sp.]